MDPKLQKVFTSIKENQFPVDWHGHLIGKKRIKSALGDEERISVSLVSGKELMHITSNKKYVELALEKSEQAKISLQETTVYQRMEELQKFKGMMELIWMH